VETPEGILKINNVDACFDEVSGSRNRGAVIRDSTCGFIAASHSYIPHVVDAAMEEATALRGTYWQSRLVVVAWSNN